MSLQGHQGTPYSVRANGAWRESPKFGDPNAVGLDDPIDWGYQMPADLSLAAHVHRVDGSNISQASRGLKAALKILLGLKVAWGLSEVELAMLMGRSLADVAAKGTSLSESEIGEASQRERIVALVNIHRRLFGLFKDLAVERNWVHHRLPALAGKTPLSLLTDGSFRSLFAIEDVVLAMTGT